MRRTNGDVLVELESWSPENLMKYQDEILQLPLHLQTHVMYGKLQILGTNPKSEEIISFCPIVSCILQTFIAITWSRTAMFWLRYFITLIPLVNVYN